MQKQIVYLSEDETRIFQVKYDIPLLLTLLFAMQGIPSLLITWFNLNLSMDK